MGMKKIVEKLITKKNSEKSKLEKNQGGYEKKRKGFVILPIFASTSPEVRRLSISGGTLTSKIPV